MESCLRLVTVICLMAIVYAQREGYSGSAAAGGRKAAAPSSGRGAAAGGMPDMAAMYNSYLTRGSGGRGRGSEMGLGFGSSRGGGGGGGGQYGGGLFGGMFGNMFGGGGRGGGGMSPFFMAHAGGMDIQNMAEMGMFSRICRRMTGGNMMFMMSCMNQYMN